MTSKRNMFKLVKPAWTVPNNTPEPYTNVKNGAKDDNALVATEEDHKVARDYINSLPRCSVQ